MGNRSICLYQRLGRSWDHRRGLVVLAILMLLAGCGSTPAVTTPIPPTATPIPPAATFPTAAPIQPTATPAPPTETPAPTPELLPLLAEKNIGPEGSIHSVDWSPDGQMIATTGHDHVRLWDGETYEELATLEGFARFVYSARWSPDGSLLAVAAAAEPIRLYDARTYTEQSVLSGPTAHLLAWSPDGKLLAAGSALNRRVQVWNVETAALTFELEVDDLVSGLAWSPDGAILAVGQWDASVILWDAHTHARLQRLIDGRNIPAENDAQGLSWSPDGHLIAYIQRHDGHWRLWDTQTGELVRRVIGHNSQGFSLSWAPNRPLLASVGWEKVVRIWNVETGQEVGAGECSALALRSVDWSPDGHRIIVGSGLFPHWSSPEIICIMEVP